MKRFARMAVLMAAVVAAAAGTVTACGDKKAAAGGIGGDDGVFTIAYAPNESTAASADARKGLADDLGKFLGVKVAEIQATDYNAIIEALRTGKAEMAYMGSQALALGRTRTKIEPIAMKAAQGRKDLAVYHSVFIVKSGNKAIKDFKDIKGKTIAFVDPGSTSGNLVPSAEIIKAFPDDKLNSDELHANGKFFQAVSFSGAHQAGLQAVLKGDVDVVPISDQILDSEIEHGNAPRDGVRIIHESAPIPAECMVVSERV
ncbi:MAG: phosphate/phosphite/phosphonate ABC transporter substrate-binding protein, partial [Succinivibrio sp.]